MAETLTQGFNYKDAPEKREVRKWLEDQIRSHIGRRKRYLKIVTLPWNCFELEQKLLK